jgi:hypothetical protein
MLYAVLPCHKRLEQTEALVPRLRAMAGLPITVIAVAGQESAVVVRACASVGARGVIATQERLSYWQAMDLATRELPDEAVVANVANDVLPMWRWFQIAQQRLGNSLVVGFNGDGHDVNHACHFLTSMHYIRSLGGWPTWYKHNYGDTEICARAIEQRTFYKEPWAVLYHNHVVMGNQPDEAHADIPPDDHDRRLFRQRREAGWK